MGRGCASANNQCLWPGFPVGPQWGPLPFPRNEYFPAKIRLSFETSQIRSEFGVCPAALWLLKGFHPHSPKPGKGWIAATGSFSQRGRNYTWGWGQGEDAGTSLPAMVAAQGPSVLPRTDRGFFLTIDILSLQSFY